MKNFNSELSFLTKSKMEKIYETSLQILERVGMKIDDERFLNAIESKGAKVDYQSRIAKFPKKLLMDTMQKVARDNLSMETGEKQEAGTKPDHREKKYGWGGGPAIYYLDYEKSEIRKGNEEDALKIIQLADAIPEIGDISSTMLVYSVDLEGREFDPRLYTLKSVVLTAKNTSKISYAENIYSIKEIEYLIKIGNIIQHPFFFGRTSCVISPLKLEKDAANILYYLLKNGFGCSVGTMPISGATSPVTIAGTIALANAEILGVWTAAKAVNPEVKCSYVSYPGSLDMRSGDLVYGTPDVLLESTGIQELCRYFYNDVRHGLGSLYIDAKLPSSQVAIERSLYYFCGAASGIRSLGHFGFLSQGQVISPEQALIDLETAKWVERYFQGFEVDEETLGFEAIQRVGIGGNFLEDEHTVKHMRREHWVSEIFDRGKAAEVSFKNYLESDMLTAVNKKIKKLMKNYQPFKLDKSKSEELDKIIKEAEKDLLQGE
jgi:trimethylamine--corrinoid protein Co-methyltransferase